MKALEETFAQTMASEVGYNYAVISFQEKNAQEGVLPMLVFGMSPLFVCLILPARKAGRCRCGKERVPEGELVRGCA